MTKYRGDLASREAALAAVKRIEKLLSVTDSDEFLNHVLSEAHQVVRKTKQKRTLLKTSEMVN